MDEFKNILNAIGAMAEMTFLFRDTLRSKGVPDEEAIELTKAYMHEILSLNKHKEDN